MIQLNSSRKIIFASDSSVCGLYFLVLSSNADKISETAVSFTSSHYQVPQKRVFFSVLEILAKISLCFIGSYWVMGVSTPVLSSQSLHSLSSARAGTRDGLTRTSCISFLFSWNPALVCKKVQAAHGEASRERTQDS